MRNETEKQFWHRPQVKVKPKLILRQNATRATNGKKTYIVYLFIMFSACLLYLDALEKIDAAENIVNQPKLVC